jgi:transposase-like protein
VRLDWQVSNFIGGIRLKVDAADEADARELLAQSSPESIEFDEGEEFEQPHCPVCGSKEITFQGSSRGAAIASLYLLSVPLPLGKKTWICNSCGAQWEDADGNITG